MKEASVSTDVAQLPYPQTLLTADGVEGGWVGGGTPTKTRRSLERFQSPSCSDLLELCGRA